MISLVIYTRPDCHLCTEMKQLIDRVVAEMRMPVGFEEINIASDPDLEGRYGLEVPVLLINGKKAAKYRMAEAELRRRLASASQ